MRDPSKEALDRSDRAYWAQEEALAEASGYDIEDWVRRNKAPKGASHPRPTGGSDAS